MRINTNSHLDTVSLTLSLSLALEATSRAVNKAVMLAKQTKDSLEALEEKVEENEAALRTVLE